MEIQTQTQAQFKMLHGEQSKQSKTTMACFDVIFNNVNRNVAAREHGITEQSICTFIRNNEYKHAERHLYIEKGKVESETSNDE